MRAWIIAALALLVVSTAQAQTVSGQTVKTQTEVIFYVTEGTNSPYQGRLVYDAAAYTSLPKGKLTTDQLAQYATWKANLAALKNAPPPTADDIAKQVIDLQTQKSLLDQQINALMADPAVAAKVPK